MMENKKSTLFLVFISTLLLGCFTKFPGPKASAWDYEPGKSFSDLHPEYVSIFHLRDDEISVLGSWLPREKSEGFMVFYYLAPNHYASVSFSDLAVSGGTQKLVSLEGVWEVREGVLYVRSFVLGTISKVEGEERESHWRMIKPFEWKVIEVRDLDADGYSLKPFEKIQFPQEVKKLLMSAPVIPFHYMYRRLRSLQEFSGGFSYVFENIKCMARYPDASLIFTNLETFEEYLDDLKSCDR